MPEIYLDVCCLNRPYDDQMQDRIHLEAEAILLILTHVETGDYVWIGSEVLGLEINQTPDAERRARVRALTQSATKSILVNEPEVQRAQELEELGFHPMDALHLACAESGGVEIFLTTDDRLLRKASGQSAQLKIRVENPLVWIQEQENVNR